MPAGPVTFVQADRIGEVTCDVKGDTATGIVSYEVPKLYRGKFHYVAGRKGGAGRLPSFPCRPGGFAWFATKKGRGCKSDQRAAASTPAATPPRRERGRPRK